jgi:hypothetical protein
LSRARGPKTPGRGGRCSFCMPAAETASHVQRFEVQNLAESFDQISRTVQSGRRSASRRTVRVGRSRDDIFLLFNCRGDVFFGFSKAHPRDCVSIVPGIGERTPRCSARSSSETAGLFRRTEHRLSIFAPYLQLSADLDFSFRGKDKKENALLNDMCVLAALE